MVCVVFYICGALYNFTRRPQIAQHYDGTKCLLEQIWTGYLATICAMKNSYQDLLGLLEFVGSYCKSSGEDVAEAIYIFSAK